MKPITPIEDIATVPPQTLIDEASVPLYQSLMKPEHPLISSTVVYVRTHDELSGRQIDMPLLQKRPTPTLKRESIQQAKDTAGFHSNTDLLALMDEKDNMRLSHMGRVDLAEKRGEKTVVDLIDTLMNFDQIWTHDFDGTLTFSKIFRTNEGKLDVEEYYRRGDIQTLMNLDAIIVKSLLGIPQHICTGKGKNFGIVKEYISERMGQIANAFGMKKRMHDGALQSLLDRNRGVFFAISVGNGADTEEIVRHEKLVHKVLPISAWEGMSKHADLLRKSTKVERIAQIARVKGISGYIPYNEQDYVYRETEHQKCTNVVHRVKKQPLNQRNYNKREISRKFTQAESTHIRRLQQSVQDHALFEEDQNTKCNYVINFEAIIENRDGIGDEWRKATGITIRSVDDFMNAFRKLSKSWNIKSYVNEAHGTIYVDINPPKMHKGVSARLVKNAAQFFMRRDLEHAGISTKMAPKLMTFTMADGHVIGIQNDSDLLHRTRGAVVTKKKERYHKPDANGYPVYLGDILGIEDPLTHAYAYLYDTTMLSCPTPIGMFVEDIVQNLNEEHAKKMMKSQRIKK